MTQKKTQDRKRRRNTRGWVIAKEMGGMVNLAVRETAGFADEALHSMLEHGPRRHHKD